MKIATATLVFALFFIPLASEALDQRPVHTYSIVARDPQTGEMGVAAQSHWFSIGPLVVWGEAGVGVVATQSFIDPNYGYLGLKLMQAGLSAEQALTALKAADPHPEVRQVAMLDAAGTIAAHTGENCIAEAGHLLGEHFAVQANLMIDDGVWPAMAEAFMASEGEPLEMRLLAALEAAQALGGDLRGQQSAAMLIVKPEASGQPWRDRLVDLRIEDHPQPIKELRRLLRINRAYAQMKAGDEALEAGEVEKALEAYAAADALYAGNPEMKFWHAVSLVNAGRLEEAIRLFQTVFAADTDWAVLVPRLVEAELLAADQTALEKILAAAPAEAPALEAETE